MIDEVVRKIIDSAHDNAKEILENHLDQLHLMADALMKFETIDASQIDQIMEGIEPDPPEGWDDNEPQSKPKSKDENQGQSPIGGPAEQV